MIRIMNRIDVTDFTTPDLQIYTCRSEIHLLHYYEPDPGLFIAESLRVIGRALDAGYEPVSMLVEPSVLGRTDGDVFDRIGDTPVYVADAEKLAQLAGFRMTDGAMCAMRRRTLPTVESVCAGAGRIAVLEGVTNPTNVGAVFRSAAALGVTAVLLTGDCSDPLYRRAARVSMGTVFQIPWTFMTDAKEHMYRADVAKLKLLGYTTVAMALTDRSVSISDERLQRADRLAILLGNENFGLSEETIRDCDFTARIPMQNGVDSLNVAAASAVAFWELCKGN